MADSNIWKILGHVGAVAGVISAILGGWWKVEDTFDTKVKTNVAASTALLSKEIQEKTLSIAEMHRDDLKVRITILKREIESYRVAGREVPDRLIINLESLQDQLEELDRKWFATN